MKNFPVLLILPFLATSLSLQLSEPTKDRYSACYPDRGYMEKDALQAASFLWQNATFANGVNLTTNNCIYKNVNSTIVSVCNGDHRNRTVFKDEVKRGIEQLMKDCGGGGSFNGIHVVNNLTIAAYGIYGGKNMAVPTGANPPDLPAGGGKRSLSHKSHQSRQGPTEQDPCVFMSFDGINKTDCWWKYKLNSDGSCGPITPENKCQVFCEQTRTGLLGIEQPADGVFGEGQPPGEQYPIEEGNEVSVSNGISVGVEGVLREVFGAGVSYQWSTTITKTKSTQHIAEGSEVHFGRWVVFPKYVHSCGTISRRKYVHDSGAPCGPGCVPVTKEPTCEGDVETFKEQCSLTPWLVDGQAQAFWVYRWENDAGKPVPMDQQSPSYKGLCNKATGLDPDRDKVNECNTQPQNRMFPFPWK
ncbi:hypothetical protein BKA64DRAFT_768096 [Cadophora sp. MPI-SDFR-AT-0126]|nr:hypothetical protein BKA64DRAFT_768096 [Leotiomycetes sp. MPI-SDFR-AT-0126]